MIGIANFENLFQKNFEKFGGNPQSIFLNNM